MLVHGNAAVAALIYFFDGIIIDFRVYLKHVDFLDGSHDTLHELLLEIQSRLHDLAFRPTKHSFLLKLLEDISEHGS